MKWGWAYSENTDKLQIIGTNKSYILRVETGTTEPRISTFYRIVATLGLTVELSSIAK